MNKVENMEEQIVNESSADGNTVIDVIDIRKSYHRGGMEIPVLNGIDLTVRSGEFIAIMGPNDPRLSTGIVIKHKI